MQYNLKFPSVTVYYTSEQPLPQLYPNYDAEKWAGQKDNKSNFTLVLLDGYNFTNSNILGQMIEHFQSKPDIDVIYTDMIINNTPTYNRSFNIKNIQDKCIINTPFLAKKCPKFNKKLKELQYFDFFLKRWQVLMFYHLQLMGFTRPTIDMDLVKADLQYINEHR
jgi:hypothetical protein